MSMQSSVTIKRIKRSSFPIANPLRCSGKEECGCPACEEKRNQEEPEDEEQVFIVQDGYASM
jgi:hypothetical protein